MGWPSWGVSLVPAPSTTTIITVTFHPLVITGSWFLPFSLSLPAFMCGLLWGRDCVFVIVIMFSAPGQAVALSWCPRKWFG